MSDVFISYTRVDAGFVRRLAGDLEAEGWDVFYDEKMAPGESWVEVLSTAIERSRYQLLVLTPHALESQWLKQEIQLGLVGHRRGRPKVIPLILEECELPPYLRPLQRLDFTGQYEIAMRELMSVLRGGTFKKVADEEERQRDKHRNTEELTKLREELDRAVALFKRDRGSIKSAEKEASSSPNAGTKCFIVMPFGDEGLEVVYEDFVRPVIEDRCALTCERGDDVFGSSVIMDDIRASIERADIVVADLTGKNANVFYEVGICHTLEKPVLLLAQSIDDVPFDLRHRRILLYEYSPRGCKRLEKSLQENLLAMLQKSRPEEA